MTYRIEPKRRIVVAKVVRRRPVRTVRQRLEESRVEFMFQHPGHSRSLLGILAPYVKKSIPDGEPWRRAKELAWTSALRERMKRWM